MAVLGGGMAETDDYRGNLAACWRMAEKASNEVEKRAWLEMAESWKLLIISGYEGIASKDFETASHEIDRRGRPRRRGTGRSFALSRALDGCPVWLIEAISSALELNDTIWETSRSSWLACVGWWQERGFDMVCSAHRWSVWLMKRCFTEGCALDKARATFGRYLFRSEEDRRVLLRRAAQRRNFSSLPGQPHTESRRQIPTRRRA